MQMMEVETGEIILEGVNVLDLPCNDLLTRIKVVLQDPFIC